MTDKPKPPVAERRFLSTPPGAEKKATGNRREGEKKPPPKLTDPLPKR